jgi:hypothetical protein
LTGERIIFISELLKRCSMSRSLSLGGLLIAIGAACAAYGHFADPNLATILSAVGALLAAIGKSVVSEDGPTSTLIIFPKKDVAQKIQPAQPLPPEDTTG